MMAVTDERDRSTSQRQSWSQYRSYPHRRRWRLIRGVITSALVLLLCGLFAYLALGPLLHPQPHLAVLIGANYQPLQMSPIPAGADGQSLEAIAQLLRKSTPTAIPTQLNHLRSAQSMAQLGDQLAALQAAPRDALILYVMAHAISDDGTGYLLCGDFSTGQSSVSRWSIQELLTQVSQSGAAVKLLILDSGWLRYDPRLGMLVNEFPRLLQDAVNASGDERLWVFNANSSHQRALDSPALGHSIFGFFVARGLLGAADLDQDQDVDLRELNRYVSANVSAWARESTDGLAVQTPQLTWGGKGTIRRWPILLSTQAYQPPGSSNKSKSDSNGQAASKAVIEQSIADVVDAVAQSRPPVVFPAPRTVGATASPNTPAALSGASGDQTSAGGSQSSSTSATTTTATKSKTSASTDSDTASGNAQTANKTQTGNNARASAETQPSGTKSSGSDAKLQSSASPAELVVQGWALRDRVLRSTSSPTSLIRLAPQLLRAYERTLLGYELALRRGDTLSSEQLRGLRELVIPLAQQNGAPAPSRFGPPTLTDRILTALAQPPQPQIEPRSIGLAEQLTRGRSDAKSVKLRQQIAEFDTACKSESSKPLVDWLAQNAGSALSEYLEVQLAQRLVDLPDVAWSLVQLAIGARRTGEQVAASQWWSAPWIEETVDAADSARLAGELELLTRVNPQWERQARIQLEQSLELYQSSAGDLAVVRNARNRLRGLLYRAPYYVKWHATGPTASELGPHAVQLEQLLVMLHQLGKILGRPTAADVAELARLQQQISLATTRIDAALDDAGIAILLDSEVVPGDTFRLESLLSTPLLPAESRVRLLNAIYPTDAAITRQVQFPSGSQVAVVPELDTPDNWDLALKQLELEVRLAHLADLSGTAGGNRLQPLQQAGAAAKKSLELYAAKPNSNKLRNATWLAFGSAGQQLKEFYTRLPERIEHYWRENSDLSDPATRAERLAQLHAVNQALYLVDPRDAERINGVTPSRQLQQADEYNLLAWHAQRAEKAQSAGLSVQTPYLRAVAEQYRQDASRIPGQPTIAPEPASPLLLDAPNSVRLTLETQQMISVSLASTAAAPRDVWLSAEYDADILELSSESEGTVAHNPPPSQGLLSGKPTFQLQVGFPQTLEFTVKRIPETAQPTRLVLTVATRTGTIRREIAIVLPKPLGVSLACSGTEGTWADEADAMMLYPFANELTQYTCFLVNKSGAAKTVEVQMLAATITPDVTVPQGAVPPEDAQSLLGKFGAEEVVADLKKVAVPSGGAGVPLPFPKSPTSPTGAKPPSAAGEKGAETSNGATQNEAPGGSTSQKQGPFPRSADAGLLVVLTDPASSWQAIRRVSIEPQRPQRFLRAEVGYSLSRQQFEVQVTPRDTDRLPPAGVKLTCQVDDEVSGERLLVLKGSIAAPAYRASMTAPIAAGDERRVVLTIGVDGYPRAFLYRFTCDRDAPEIPEDSDWMGVRITSPAPGTAYPGSVDSIPITLRVDAPPGVLQDSGNAVDVGLDHQRDRELENDQYVSLRADRSVSVSLAGLAPKGVMHVQAKATDFNLNLPLGSAQNTRANVLGRVRINGRVVYSRPVEVVLDGVAPLIRHVEAAPAGFVTIGDAIALTITAQDSLSGVQKVEAAFDMSGTGEFAAKPPPLSAAQQPDGSWMLTLPTDKLTAGNYTVLVRATDRVGNASQYTRIKTTMLSKEQAAARMAAMVVTVAGSVTYGGQGQPDIEVTLNSEKGKTFSKMKTNAQGGFTIPRVPPGKYTLDVEGVVRNKTRKASQPLEIKPGERVEPLEIKLPF